MIDDREQLERFVRNNPDASAMRAVAAIGLDPDEWLSVARDLTGRERDESGPESTPDADEGDHIHKDTNDESDAQSTDAGGDDRDADPWGGADFSSPESGVYASDRLAFEQWMGRQGKRPFALWSDRDADLECTKTECPEHKYYDEDGSGDAHTAPPEVIDECDACEKHRREEGVSTAECDHDARYKWGHAGHYVDGETIALAEADPKLDGRVFIQQEDGPFAFVDGDKVRCRECGEVHPAFVAVLNKLGLTYADVSQSDAGVHAPYRGELPDGVKQASWYLDAEPWGTNDERPKVEIFANKHVCVDTGQHVPGTPLEVREWDEDALVDLLDEHDQLAPQPREQPDTFDLDDHTPAATTADEVTGDPRDVSAAIDRLDARNVAGKTIVGSWNPSATTSPGKRAFIPVGAGPGCNGTANIVDEDIWQDTGGGGWGGPVVMALVDLGKLSHENASPSLATGELWGDGVEHLQALGFAIPTCIPAAGSKRSGGGTRDKTPFWAVRKAAVEFGVLDSDGFVTREGDDGETYDGFPDAETYNRALDAIEDAGIEHGRERADGGRTPIEEKLGLTETPETEEEEIEQFAVALEADRRGLL